jgi:hypothetical protein
MNIDSRALIAGVSIVEVRDFLRMHAERGWHPEALRGSFGRERADQLLLVLISEGYVERIEDRGALFYGNTAKGGQLARASAGRPVVRATAERALKDFLARCEQVRHEPDFLYTVERAILFGSMLTDKATVSDVDIAVKLRPKERDRDRHFAFTQARRNSPVKLYVRVADFRTSSRSLATRRSASGAS